MKQLLLIPGKAFQPTEALLFSFMYVVVGFAFGQFFGRYETHKRALT